MYRERLPIDSAKLDSGYSELALFDKAYQVFAVWSDKALAPQQNYIDFFPTVSNLEREIERFGGEMCFCTEREDLFGNERLKILLAVEGADLLCGNLSRLHELYSRGMRLLTLMWKGENCAGGAHDTEKGLTDFGKSLVLECERLGIAVDLSHASRETFCQAAQLGDFPIIASHSNSYSICPHTRNLTDDEFCEIVRRRGLVGINLHAPFVISGASTNEYSCDELFEALCEHIMYFLSLGGEKTVCLGADRDGIPRADGYTPARFVHGLYEKLIKNGINEKIIKDIFSGNAKSFFENHLPPKGRI